MRKFEKTHSKTLFHKFTQRFVDKGFSNPWKPAINRFFETKRWLYATPSKQTWLP
jgi:hypothetical protein